MATDKRNYKPFNSSWSNPMLTQSAYAPPTYRRERPYVPPDYVAINQKKKHAVAVKSIQEYSFNIHNPFTVNKALGQRMLVEAYEHQQAEQEFYKNYAAANNMRSSDPVDYTSIRQRHDNVMTKELNLPTFVSQTPQPARSFPTNNPAPTTPLPVSMRLARERKRLYEKHLEDKNKTEKKVVRVKKPTFK